MANCLLRLAADSITGALSLYPVSPVSGYHIVSKAIVCFLAVWVMHYVISGPYLFFLKAKKNNPCIKSAWIRPGRRVPVNLPRAHKMTCVLHLGLETESSLRCNLPI